MTQPAWTGLSLEAWVCFWTHPSSHPQQFSEVQPSKPGISAWQWSWGLGVCRSDPSEPGSSSAVQPRENQEANPSRSGLTRHRWSKRDEVGGREVHKVRLCTEHYPGGLVQGPHGHRRGHVLRLIGITWECTFAKAARAQPLRWDSSVPGTVPGAVSVPQTLLCSAGHTFQPPPHRESSCEWALRWLFILQLDKNDIHDIGRFFFIQLKIPSDKKGW